jgi:hypothetical protein
MGDFFQVFFRESSCLVWGSEAAALSPSRNNVLPALSPFRWCVYQRRRACGAVSPAGLSGSSRFRFSVDPSGFDRRSWSSEFLQALIDVFSPG